MQENKKKKNTSKKQSSPKTKSKTNTTKVVKEQNAKIEESKKVETKAKVEANNKPKETKAREEVKKEIKSSKETKGNMASPMSGSEISNLIKIIAVIVAIFLIFYGITSLVTKNEKEDADSEDVEPTIQYSEILLGTLFNQPKSEYFVLVTKEDDDYKSAYSTYMAVYQGKEGALTFYTASLDEGLNKSYVGDTDNIVNNLKELKFTTSTLLKIKNKKIIASYVGEEKILAQLKTLIK